MTSKLKHLFIKLKNQHHLEMRNFNHNVSITYFNKCRKIKKKKRANVRNGFIMV